MRDSPLLVLQWIDSKPVTILTTIHLANEQVSVKRRAKRGGVYREVNIPQPLAIHMYNHFMNGVDTSDQMLACHNISRKCYCWWKTLLFHLIDIAVVNSFLLFERYHEQHREVEVLRQLNNYSIVDYREALVRQICGFEEYDAPPAYVRAPPGTSQFETAHMPMVSDVRRNCAVCYREGRGQMRVTTYCNVPQCQKFLHISSSMNCFEIWHSAGYHKT